MEQYLWVLKRDERDLIREVEPDRLAVLDEDGLLQLHKRVRKARNKHTGNYRRRAAERVEEVGARGQAASKSDKARARAYVFEEALALVSAELSRVAHEAAETLKDERLARARAGKPPGPHVDAPVTGGVADAGRPRSHQKTSGAKKRDASSQAAGARRQAKRDGR